MAYIHMYVHIYIHLIQSGSWTSKGAPLNRQFVQLKRAFALWCGMQSSCTVLWQLVW